MSKILDDLEAAARRALQLSVWNYRTVYALTFLAVGASVAATLMAATGSKSQALLATLAAIPAAVALATNTFKFNSRSDWHDERHRKLISLHRHAIAGAAHTTDPEIAEKWGRIEDELSKSWPAWGDVHKAGKPTV